MDSNGRELLAILYGLKSFRRLLSGKVVKFFTDNRNVAIISRKGSTSLRLHRLALDIFSLCLEHCITLEIEWLPRTLNEYADCLSRVIDYDDWSISQEFYDHASSLFCPFTVDRFASSLNAKCTKFYSKFWCPGTLGVDAFSTDWANENNWLVPPLYLVPCTVFHLEHCRARGVLIVPAWQFSVFWPVLFPSNGPRFSIMQVMEFSDPRHIFGPSPAGLHTIFSDSHFKSPVLVIVLDAS